MQYHKPDIIVILAVLVSIGVVVTTTVQAGEVPDEDITVVSPQALTPGAEKVHCEACTAPVRHKDLVLGSKGGETRPGAFPGSGDTLLDSGYSHAPGGFNHLRGMRYDFMFNRFRAVMYMGGSSVDFTLKLDNLHTPAEDLNPYLSLSLGSRW